MSRFLGIDWDHDSLYLIVGSTKGKAARVEQALIWNESHTLDPAAAEAAGKRLRERLKEAKVAPGPVLACLGRERVIFKELRYPAVDEKQEPALVQFQATKELTEPANRVVMDYARLKGAGPGGERRAILTVARKPLVQALQALCKGAGLTLACLSPRPFGIARCLRQAGTSSLAAPAPAAGASVAVLTLAKNWAEFCIVRDGEIRLARPLTLGENLLEDVRRNLALYANQNQANAAVDSVKALYFSGDSDHAALLERLKETLAIPVHALDPFAAEEQVKVAGDRGGFAGIVGLALLWAEQQTPVNLASPKETKVDTGAKRRMAVLVGALAVVLVLGSFVVAHVELGNKQKEVQDYKKDHIEQGMELEKLKPDGEKLGSLRQWDDTALYWADEFYKLTGYFPSSSPLAKGFHINYLHVAPIGGLPTAKEPYTMQMTLKGNVPHDKTYLVDDLIHKMNADPLWRAKREYVKRKGDGEDIQEFSIKVDLAKRPPTEEIKSKTMQPAPPPNGLKKAVGAQDQGF